MRVLFVSSEAYPFIKTGGLGDVAYALPKALRKLGIDARVIIPNYSNINEEYKKDMVDIGEFNLQLGWRNQHTSLYFLDGEVPCYFIDNEYYFSRNDYYGYYDDGERFAYFSKAVLESIKYIKEFAPDIIHCNDWHSGIIPVLLKDKYYNEQEYKNIKTVYTIHNLRYQGIFGKEVLGDILSLDEEYYSEDKLKYYDGISFMKGGIIYADKVSTVSKTYAEEIKTEEYGEGLHGLLRYYEGKLRGIVNGIDYDLYDPEKDEELFVNYGYDNCYLKEENKLSLQKELNLKVDNTIPMIGMITRLVDQKGLDLVSKIMDELIKKPIQLVVLGTGFKEYEDMFKRYAYMNPEKVSINLFFSEALAKKIYASSDIFLMPSRFEPCGIGQLLAMRYGSIPVVRETGGLKDTVNINNGFTFKNYYEWDFFYVLDKALEAYYDKSKWKDKIKSAMISENSWSKSANEYLALYNECLWG
ncbi:glycogen synthase GlgA [Clostridium malenominatum]|uniref:Glycogen synthase n=1 Tax=Clostridium malenominatum TaxID=1539 RepID=A0ABN1IQ59_9CLOT